MHTKAPHTASSSRQMAQPLNRGDASPLPESQDDSFPPAPGGQSYSTSGSESKKSLGIVPVKVRSHDSGKTVKQTMQTI